MEKIELLGALVQKLHMELRSTYYLLLPLFFCLSLKITWLKTPTGGPDTGDVGRKNGAKHGRRDKRIYQSPSGKSRQSHGSKID